MSGSRPLPIALERDLIVEAIFEIRFRSDIESPGELLPGLIYPHLKDEFRKLEKLPLASFPREVIQNDPSLSYQPTTRLVGDNQTLLIGDQVFGLSNSRPYQGWSRFRATILKMAEILKGTGILSSIDRYSMRYTNLIPLDGHGDGLDAIRASVILGEWNLAHNACHIRTEITEGSFLNVIQVINKAAVARPSVENAEGLLLDIDTMRVGPFPDFWENFDEYIDDAHQCEKRIFFSLLTDETLQTAGPIWSS